MPNHKEMKKVYNKPKVEVYSIDSEALMVVNSQGQTGGTIPGMGWGDNGGNTGGTIPGMGWSAFERRDGWNDYENN